MQSELECLRERIRELEVENEGLRQSQQTLATEQETLQHVATQLINAYGMQSLYEQIVDTAVAITHSDFATIQMFYPKRGTSGELRLLCHRGFSSEAAKRWEWVRPETRTTCGEALRTGRRVAAPDLRNCDFMAGSDDLEGHVSAGVLAAQTTPLVSRSGELLGMVSTHWCEPHELSVSELRALDILARLAADLIDRSRFEEQLRESEERFRTMADAAPVMIWTSGTDKLCTFFNKGWLEFTGRSLDQELGNGWAAGVHPDDLEQCYATYSSSFDERRNFQMEYRLCRADGEYRWVLDDGVPRFAPDGVFAGYIGSCIDITDVKRTLEAAVASQKLETVGQLASGIAHDFNNLLGSILASAEVGLDGSAGSSAEEELLRIRTAAIRGAEMVSQLMIYSGKENPTFEMVDASLLVEEMMRLLKMSISKHVILETDLGEALPAVHANPAQIRQVVMNLVTNASEAIGDRDGVIRVTISRVRVGPDAPVTGASALARGCYLMMQVSDSGSGMTPEVQTRIFDPFFTTKFTGRGLGLATVQGIVRGHGGAINVVSSLGQGTRFEVLLPCADQPARDFRDTAPATSGGTEGSVTGTVLVIEDEDTLRLSVSKILRAKGFSVIEASDGGAAVDLIRANELGIAVVLLDMTLPGMSGSQVFTELRRMRPDVKVILTSAYSYETVLTAVGAPLGWDFVRKPYHLNDLLNSVRDACRPGISQKA